MNFGVLWCTLVYFWGVLWCTTMDYGVLLRCTSVYFSVLQWTKVYFGVQQCTSEKFSKIQLNSAPLLATIPDCDALSEVSTGKPWQLAYLFFCLCLLVLSLSSSGTFYLVAVLFVLFIFFLSYSPGVTFNIQSDFAICIFCYHVFPLPLRIARFPVCLFLFVCLKQPVTGSAVTSCCRVIDLWSTFHQSFCLHFIFSGDVIYNFSLQS